MLGMNKNSEAILFIKSTVHLTTFLLKYPFDMTLMSGIFLGQYHKVTHSYIGSKAADNFVLPTKDISLFLLFKHTFHNIKSQDTIFPFILFLCNNKTIQDEILKSVFGTDVHFLNLNSKIFDRKLYANFEILFKFSLNLTWLSRGKNSLNFQILLWEGQFSPLKLRWYTSLWLIDVTRNLCSRTSM